MRWAFWRKAPEAKADFTELTWSALLGEPQTGSGVSVTTDSALRVSTVLACARVLAEGVAQMPLRLYRSGEDGSKTPAEEHPVYWLLYRRPNEWMTSFEFREVLTLHAALTGNGYAFVNRLGDGRIRELIPLLPGNVTVEQAKDYTLSYRVRGGDGGEIAVIPWQNMLHLRGPSWDGFRGMNSVQLAREAIGLSVATEQAQGKLFSNGARPGGILSTEQVLTEGQITRIREAFAAAYSGSNQFKTAVLDGGFKYAQTTMTGVDAQQLESRKFQIEEICRFFRVYPAMIGYSDKASTYASVEQFFLAHVVHSLGPWIERWEQALSRDLLTDDELKSGIFPKFAVQGLLRGDAKSRVEYYRGMVNIAAMNPNEVRSLEELNPYEGGETFRAALNTVDATLPPPDVEDAAPAPKEIADDAAV